MPDGVESTTGRRQVVASPIRAHRAPGSKPTAEYRSEAKRRHLYRISIEQFESLLEAQGGVCGICGTDSPGGKGGWHVDHDHACCPTKRSCGRCVRGLLCAGCNMALGRFLNVETLVRMVSYLGIEAEITISSRVGTK